MNWLRRIAHTLLAITAFVVPAALYASEQNRGFIGPVAASLELTDDDYRGKDPIELLGPGAEALVEILDRAVSTFPSVATAEAGARAAKANLAGARWQRFPSVTGEFLGFGTEGAGGNDFVVLIDQPIWAAGRINSAIRASKQRLTSAEAGIELEKLNVAVRTANIFFEFQRLVQTEAILQEGLNEHRKLVETMERRVEREISPASDLELARARTAQVEQELTLATGRRRIALTALRQMTNDPGLQITSIIRYQPELHHPKTAGLVDQALQFDPARQQLKAQARAANEEIAARRAQIFPQLSLQYQRLPFGPDRVGFVVRAQANGGLSALSAVSEAEQDREAAEQQIFTNERQLIEEIETDILENSAARDRMVSSNVSAASSQAVTESYLRQFVAGRRGWFDVMNAVREAMTARLAELDARVSAISSASRLLLRTGQWRPGYRPIDTHGRGN